MTQAQRIPDYLAHILEAIDRIHRYTSDMDEASFLANELVQDAVFAILRDSERLTRLAQADPWRAGRYRSQPRHGVVTKHSLIRGPKALGPRMEPQ